MSQIRDLFGILFAGETEGKFMATMFGGFIDDSADRDRERVVISAVLIGNFSSWKYLTRCWNKRLKEDGIEYFRSSECNHLRKQFFKYCSTRNYPAPRGREAADRIRSDLDKIIKKSKAVGIGIVIPIGLYKKLAEEERYASVIPKDPYHWAVQSIWHESADAVRRIHGANSITFAHDIGPNYVALHKLYLDYKSRNPGDARILRDFVALDDKANPPVQAADAIADVTFRYSEEWARHPTPANMRRLRGTMFKVSVWDEGYARAVLDEMLESKEGAGKPRTGAGGEEKYASNTAKSVP